MSKKSFITLILFVVSAVFVQAEENTTSAAIFNAVFSYQNNTARQRSAATIQNKLKSAGFTASAPVASKVDVWLDNDTHFNVKSTSISYSKDGAKVTVNIPNLAKYKAHTTVILKFSTLAKRNAFYKECTKHGFWRDEDAVEGVTYSNDYYLLSSMSDTDLKVYIGEY